MRASRSTRGMTLVEVLAALSILSLFIALISAWMVGSLRRHQAAVERAGSSVVLDRVMEAIAADIAESGAHSIEVDPAAARISLFTTHRLPGDEPGWKQVTWSWENHTGLTRSAASGQAEPRERRIASSLRDVTILLTETEEHHTLSIRLADGQGSRERTWELDS